MTNAILKIVFSTTSIVSMEFTILKSLIAGTTFFLKIKMVHLFLQLSHWLKNIIAFPNSVEPCIFHLFSCIALIPNLYLLNSLTYADAAVM